MGRHDWYRKTRWSDEDRADFFERLARSRFARPQYLVIQAMHLRSGGHSDTALTLLDKYFSEFFCDDLSYVQALLERARCLESLTRIDHAEIAYLAALAAQKYRPTHVTTVYTDFPWFVVRHSRQHLFAYALTILDSADLAFPMFQYRNFAVRALVAAHNREFETASRFASHA